MTDELLKGYTFQGYPIETVKQMIRVIESFPSDIDFILKADDEGGNYELVSKSFLMMLKNYSMTVMEKKKK